MDVGNPAFQRDLKGLSSDLQNAVKECFKELLKNPMPSRLRFHGLHGKHRGIFSIDITSNHAYKATFTLENGVARFRRVGSHKEIDRSP